MNGDGGREVSFQRILVALNASREGRALLDFAADLAAQLGVPLTGVFIEDTDVSGFADLPFAREISFSGAAVRELSRERMQAHFRAEAAAAERLLADVGKARRVECSFELRRGQFEAELCALARESDLLALGPSSGLIVRSRRRDVFARFKESAASGFLSVGRYPLKAREAGITVIFDGGAEAMRAVALAARIASRRETPLTVVTIRPANLDNTSAALSSILASVPNVHYMDGGSSLGGIGDRLSYVSQLLVIPSNLPDDNLENLRGFGIPTLVLRPSSSAPSHTV